MKIIFLVRHGEIDNPQKVMYGGNIELEMNNEGREQIKRVAQKIKKAGYKIYKIYASPMNRTLETASILLKEFGLKNSIVKEKKLKDVNIPALAGKPITIRKELFKSGTDEYNENYVKSGNESKKEVANRMMDIFRKAVNENPDKAVAIVSHGDPIRLLIFTLQNPDKPIPLMGELVKYDYPKKGQTIKISLSAKGKFLKKKFM